MNIQDAEFIASRSISIETRSNGVRIARLLVNAEVTSGSSAYNGWLRFQIYTDSDYDNHPADVCCINSDDDAELERNMAKMVARDTNLLLRCAIEFKEAQCKRGRAQSQDVKTANAVIKRCLKSLNLGFCAANLALYGSRRYGDMTYDDAVFSLASCA